MLAAAIGSFAFPLVARADGNSAAIAEDLFADAKRLLDQGDTAHACPKFAESLRLDPTLGTRLNLAHCYEVAGKTASAWGEYKEVLRQAQAAKDTKRAQVAQEHVAIVEAKLSRVTLHAAATDGVAFQLDGANLDAAVMGTAFPVDPGDHEIVETATGKKAANVKFHVEPQSSSNVELPPLEDAPKAEAAPQPTPKLTEPPPAEPASGSGKRTAGFIIAGVGVVSLGVGTFFGIRTLSLASDVKNDCPNGPCPTQNGVDENSSAHTSALLSDISLGVGVVAIAAGTYLILTSRSSGDTTHAKLQLAPSASPHGGGAAILGAF